MAKLTLEALKTAGFDADAAARIMALAEEPEEPETPDTGAPENPEEPETPDAGTHKDPEEPETPDIGTHEDPEGPETPDAGSPEKPAKTMEEENSELRSKLTDMQLRLAAAKAGIHPNRMDIMRKLADLEGFDVMADDASTKMDSIIAKILEQVPEFASVSTGTLGGTVRRKMSNDPFTRGFGK